MWLSIPVALMPIAIAGPASAANAASARDGKTARESRFEHDAGQAWLERKWIRWGSGRTIVSPKMTWLRNVFKTRTIVATSPMRL
jgi:hypothetical protein